MADTARLRNVQAARKTLFALVQASQHERATACGRAMRVGVEWMEGGTVLRLLRLRRFAFPQCDP
jgi:hypothetical protein